MSVNREVELTWKGENYSTMITMRDVDRFEQDPDINLAKMAERLVCDDSRKSQEVNLIAKVLNLAGCQVTPEEIWYALCDPDIAIDFITSAAITGEILDACFVKVKKSPAAVKKSRKSSRGKASI